MRDILHQRLIKSLGIAQRLLDPLLRRDFRFQVFEQVQYGGFAQLQFFIGQAQVHLGGLEFGDVAGDAEDKHLPRHLNRIAADVHHDPAAVLSPESELFRPGGLALGIPRQKSPRLGQIRRVEDIQLEEILPDDLLLSALEQGLRGPVAIDDGAG